MRQGSSAKSSHSGPRRNRWIRSVSCHWSSRRSSSHRSILSHQPRWWACNPWRPMLTRLNRWTHRWRSWTIEKLTRTRYCAMSWAISRISRAQLYWHPTRSRTSTNRTKSIHRQWIMMRWLTLYSTQKTSTFQSHLANSTWTSRKWWTS